MECAGNTCIYRDGCFDVFIDFRGIDFDVDDIGAGSVFLQLAGDAHQPCAHDDAALALEQCQVDYHIVDDDVLKPDGVADGHWRHNDGGKDLNRDWGPFTQPETQAVAGVLEKLAASNVTCESSPVSGRGVGREK